MERETGLLAALLGWSPLIIIMAVWFVWMLIATRRQGSMANICRENTEAVRANTEAVKVLIEELRRHGSK